MANPSHEPVKNLRYTYRVLSALIWKNQHNVKTANVVAQIFDRFLGQVCLEISRCCSKSIIMKVSDIIIYIMKIMWRGFKKIRSSRFRDIQKSAKSSNFERSCTQTGGEKTGQFLRSQEWKYTKISWHGNKILSSILTLLKNNLSCL